MRAMVATAAAAALLLAGCSSARTPAASPSWQAQRPAADAAGAPRAYARASTTPRVQARPTARSSPQVASQALEYRAAGSMALAAPSLPGDEVTTVGAGAAELGSPDGPVGPSAQAPPSAPRAVAPRARARASGHARPAAPCPPLRLPFCFGGT